MLYQWPSLKLKQDGYTNSWTGLSIPTLGAPHSPTEALFPNNENAIFFDLAVQCGAKPVRMRQTHLKWLGMMFDRPGPDPDHLEIDHFYVNKFCSRIARVLLLRVKPLLHNPPNSLPTSQLFTDACACYALL